MNGRYFRFKYFYLQIIQTLLVSGIRQFPSKHFFSIDCGFFPLSAKTSLKLIFFGDADVDGCHIAEYVNGSKE